LHFWRSQFPSLFLSSLSFSLSFSIAMTRAILAVLAVVAVCAYSAEAGKCNLPGETTYPPDASRALPWYTIDLDKDPKVWKKTTVERERERGRC
jgi:hypothetical protein